MIIEQIDESKICYNENHIYYIREYYLYVISLFKKEIAAKKYSINLVFGDYRCNFNNNKKSFRLDIQSEHTLVKPGGRNTRGAKTGKIPTENLNFYLVRIQNFKYLNKLDAVIEYSLANLYNIEKSGRYCKYLKRNIHIAPILYNKINRNQNRENNIITTFINTEEDRRGKILNDLSRKGITVINHTNQFSSFEVYRLYSNTRILVNVHQTPHHHTLEELRVLPALICGCLVISEEIPLKEKIPYSKFIIWAKYSEIVDTIEEVDNNYFHYFDKIINSNDLESILASMEHNNTASIQHVLERLQRSNPRISFNTIKHYLFSKRDQLKNFYHSKWNQ